MSPDFLNEKTGTVGARGAADGLRTLTNSGVATAARESTLGIGAEPNPTLLGKDSAAPSNVEFPVDDAGHRAGSRAARAADPGDSQDLFRSAVETCPSGMVMADTAGMILMANRSVEAMFGYGSGALLGRSVDILVPERFRPLNADPCDDLHAPARNVAMNVRRTLLGRRMDASEFPIELTANATRAGGFLLMLGLAADMGIQRAAEQHLEQMEARYRGLLEAAPDAMVVVNASGEIVLLNIQAEKRFGYRRDELVGQKVTNIIPRGFAERLLADARRSTEDALAQQIGAGIELSGLRKNGSAFPIEIMLSPLESVEGLLVTAAIRDITSRRNMERMKEEFVSTVSHELRTPMTSIAGALGLLAGNAGGELPKPAARLVEIAYANSQRLVRLINDILDMEKLEFGQVVFKSRRLNVRALVEQAIDANRAFAEGHGVRIRLADASERCTVQGDADRLLQVLTNLLSNAVKFSPIDEDVTVTVEPRGQSVRICVRDKGPGIPDDFRSHIFEKFARADSTDTRQKGGTGLGLSIVKQITARLGGQVGFEDAPGGGTIFHVELPSVDVDLGPDVSRDESSDSARSMALDGDPALANLAGASIARQALGRRTILLVDDDVVMLQLLAESMAVSMDVVSVETLAEARREIQKRQFDLAVLDIELGAESGLDLLPDLHDLGHRAIPVIVFSAWCTDLAFDPRIKIKLDKSRTSVGALLASVLERLEPRPSRANKEMT